MKRIACALFLLLTLMAVQFSFGQDVESLKVFEAIPSNERSRISERLKLFLEYQRTKQWTLLFDMFPKVNTQHPEITKEMFLGDIKKYGKRHITDFIPENTTSNESIEGKYAISGCAKVGKGLGKKKWQGTIYASLENGEWVLSDVYFSYQLEAHDPEPCSSQKR